MHQYAIKIRKGLGFGGNIFLKNSWGLKQSKTTKNHLNIEELGLEIFQFFKICLYLSLAQILMMIGWLVNVSM